MQPSAAAVGQGNDEDSFPLAGQKRDFEAVDDASELLDGNEDEDIIELLDSDSDEDVSPQGQESSQEVGDEDAIELLDSDSGSDSDSIPHQRRPTGVTTDGSDVWNHYASEGEFGTRLEWRAGVENILDCVGQWFSLQPEWTQGANILTAGSQAILPSTLGHNGLRQITTVWGGHFAPWERQEKTLARGLLRLNPQHRFEEQCWNAMSKFAVRVVHMVFDLPEDDVWDLVMPTTMVCNRLIGDHPHNWHSSRQNQAAYELETGVTDQLMRTMLNRLLPLLSRNVVVFPFGATNERIYEWLPDECFVTKERVSATKNNLCYLSKATTTNICSFSSSQ